MFAGNTWVKSLKDDEQELHMRQQLTQVMRDKYGAEKRINCVVSQGDESQFGTDMLIGWYVRDRQPAPNDELHRLVREQNDLLRKQLDQGNDWKDGE